MLTELKAVVNRLTFYVMKQLWMHKNAKEPKNTTNDPYQNV